MADETKNETFEGGDALTPEQKLALISRNLQEIVGEQKLISLLRERDMKVYWGTAPTGKPHIAYFVPMSKIADFLRAGSHVTILFADLHAYLDNMKAPWELLQLRTQYYQEVIKGMLEAIGVPLEKLNFVQGTSYQLDRAYTLDVYKLASLVSEHDAKKAGAEVVKQVDNAKLSGLMYPGLQALDEQYLGVDAQFGGVDQRKIFMYAEKYMPMLGYPKRIHLMNPMVPGLTGAKMSSSDASSKIDILDSPKAVAKKIRAAFCPEATVEGNGVLAFTKMVLFAVRDGPFVINRAEKYGGPISFDSYAELEATYVAGELFPLDLKQGVIDGINALLAPIRAKFAAPELQKLAADAYPTAKKAKKAKGGAKAPDYCRLDIRVGKIVRVWQPEDRPNMYFEEVDVGEEQPRTVASALKAYYPQEEMEGRDVVMVCNLKPRMIGPFQSQAMILAAASGEGESKRVELLVPPAGGAPGDVVAVEGLPAPTPDASVNSSRKNSPWVKALPFLRTTDECVAAFKGTPLATQHGPVTVPSLADAQLS